MHRRQFLVAASAGLLVAPNGAGAQTPAGQSALKESPAAQRSWERRFADYALALKFDNFPKEVVELTKDHLLDTLACAFAASDSKAAKIAEATYRKSFGDGGGATIIAGATPIATEGATLVNGVLVRDLDYNDTYFGRNPNHTSECIPAAIACCEEAGLGGRDLIEAIVLGYEAQIRMVDAINLSARGFYSTSLIAIAVPLAAGRLWRMTAEQIASAVGIAFSHQMTTLSVIRGDISMMKALPGAHTAMDSLFDTRLAAAGFTGPEGVLDWLATKVQPAQSKLEIDLDPTHFSIGKVGYKRFPLQVQLQSVVEAAVELSPTVKPRVADIKSIEVQSYPDVVGKLADPPKYRPASRETADHSLPICAAMALLDGQMTLKQFDADRWKAADVLALASKIKVTVSDALVARMPEGAGASVEVLFNDGQKASRLVEIPEGHPQRPMSRASLERKFMDSAVPVVGADKAKKVIQLVGQLDQMPDVRTLTAALKSAG